jgi:putative membrane protein
MQMQSDGSGFWRQAFALQGSVTPRVFPHVLAFGLIAVGIWGLSWLAERYTQARLGLQVAPYEVAGAALSLLLILRTTAGYERWWEARKLWGGIINQSRNLAISALNYGPADPAWQETIIRWTAAFPHVARCSLRGEPPSPEVAGLIGAGEARRIGSAIHMPSAVALRIGSLLQDACDRLGMDRFAFMQIDRQRASLIDHIGGCERILNTPLPLVYAIKIRRFIALYLVTLPFALLHRIDTDWLIPVTTMLVAYPLISLDRIGSELQNPFSRANLSHLPLGEMSATIEKNLMGLLSSIQGARTDPGSDGLAARPQGPATGDSRG